ncbi:hypothetical protein [Dethiobacter alkaliphilus]|uniref:hypothetical protein n=1 Tax=Dethiobacter alkaliphilus TaxID=427926 RepID=UPI0022267C35|nr:hypothetical protein [Dethiobacter alkaliphilus]MCW3489386.1 hypothetical protein [Dethiobacter alkaliphilus]
MSVKKRSSVFLFVIIVATIFGQSVYASADLATNLHVTDKGHLERPNSVVRYVSMLGEGTVESPFLLWYEDQSVEGGTVKFAQSSSGQNGFDHGESIIVAERHNYQQNIHRPAVFKKPDGKYGMYFLENGGLSYTESDDKKNWSEPVTVEGLPASVNGVVDTLVVDNQVWIYWIDSESGNAVKRSLSKGDSFTEFNGTANVVLNKHSYRPTGQVIPYFDGYYLFFVADQGVDNPAYAGLAYSKDGINNWTVVRNSDNPILENTTDIRHNLNDLTVANGSHVFKMFYTAHFKSNGMMTMFSETDSLVGYSSGKPVTVHVKKEISDATHGYVKTFAEALSIVTANPNSEVLVYPGTYYERDLIINKPITLAAKDSNDPLPTLNFSGGSFGFLVEHDRSRLKDLILIGNGGTALKIHGTDKPVKNINITGVAVDNPGGTAVGLNYTDGNININRNKFMRYSGKALISSNGWKEINAQENWWNTLCPANVIEGEVNFSRWATDSSLTNFTDQPGECVIAEPGEDGFFTFEINSIGTASLSFDEVTSQGTISVIPVTPVLEPPNGYRFVNGYYEILVSAGFEGNATVTLPYDIEKLAEKSREKNIELYHYTNGKWEKITTLRDMDNKTISGETRSFSPFAVVEPLGVAPPAYDSYGMNTNYLWLLVFMCFTGGLLSRLTVQEA